MVVKKGVCVCVGGGSCLGYSYSKQPTKHALVSNTRLQLSIDKHTN